MVQSNASLPLPPRKHLPGMLGAAPSRAHGCFHLHVHSHPRSGYWEEWALARGAQRAVGLYWFSFPLARAINVLSLNANFREGLARTSERTQLHPCTGWWHFLCSASRAGECLSVRSVLPHQSVIHPWRFAVWSCMPWNRRECASEPPVSSLPCSGCEPWRLLVGRCGQQLLNQAEFGRSI